MQARLLNSIPNEERKEFREIYKNNSRLREAIIKVLSSIKEETRDEMTSKLNYEQSNWDLLMADQFGFQRGLETAIQLLKR